MKEINVLSVDDLVKQHLLLDKTKKYCFRGQSSASWGLVPSFYRGLEGKSLGMNQDEVGEWIGSIERDIYREFQLEACEAIHGKNQLEILALAQHHGVPTRLLDWTYHFYIAAYFAVMDARSDDQAIWCLNLTDFPYPCEMGRKHINGAFRIENIINYIGPCELSFFQKVSKSISLLNAQARHHKVENTVTFFETPKIDGKIKNQEGLFSLYLSMSDRDFFVDHLDLIVSIEEKCKKELLTKIIIPNNAVNALRNYIENMGITPYKLFPDLYGLGKHLNHLKNKEIEKGLL